MAIMNAKIDYKSETISLNGNTFKFFRYYPAENFYNHLVTFNTSENGEWIVSGYEELNKNITVQPGLYKAKDFKNHSKNSYKRP